MTAKTSTLLARAIVNNLDTWGENAACIGKAAVLEGPDVAAAKALCLGDTTTGRPRCPVIDACHADVIPRSTKTNPDPGGVKAGRTEEERHDFRKGRAPRGRTTATKHCRRCGDPKSASEFYRHYSHKDGLASHCKPCNTELKAAHRAAKEAAA